MRSRSETSPTASPIPSQYEAIPRSSKTSPTVSCTSSLHPAQCLGLPQSQCHHTAFELILYMNLSRHPLPMGHPHFQCQITMTLHFPFDLDLLYSHRHHDANFPAPSGSLPFLPSIITLIPVPLHL